MNSEIKISDRGTFFSLVSYKVEKDPTIRIYIDSDGGTKICIFDLSPAGAEKLEAALRFQRKVLESPC